MTEYRVPRLMWEALESSLQIAGKRFVKRLANALEVPEKELLREVFKKDEIAICIHDWTNEEFMCPCWKVSGQFYIPCENVKMCGKETCKEHTGTISKQPPNALYKFSCLIDDRGECGNKEEGGKKGECEDQFKKNLNNMLCYTEIANLISMKNDIDSLASVRADGTISIDDFINSVCGYYDEDGILKIAM